MFDRVLNTPQNVFKEDQKVFFQIFLKADFTVLRCMYFLENKLETREDIHICNIIGLVEIDEFIK